MVERTQPKNLIRAIGSELAQCGIPGALADPSRGNQGSGVIVQWQHTTMGGIITKDQVKDIQNSGHAPTQASESAIIATLPLGNYTAIVRGKSIIVGVALVEVYDLDYKVAGYNLLS